MPCVRIPNGILCLGGEDVTIEVNGRPVTFEWHPYFGPMVLTKSGDVAARQPGERSAFWPAFERWWADQKRAKEDAP